MIGTLSRAKIIAIKFVIEVSLSVRVINYFYDVQIHTKVKKYQNPLHFYNGQKSLKYVHVFRRKL